MSSVRIVTADDLASVARLFQSVLRKSGQPATPDLEACLADAFLAGPNHDPEIMSRVHLDADGKVNGFIGVMAMPLLVEGRAVRGALCGTMMVENHTADPFAGARLMRAFLSGPQDVSLTETANDISADMWRRLGGTVLPDHSLEWLRIIRPAGFFAAMAASALAPARLLKPLAAPFDRMLRRRPSGWAHLNEIPAAKSAPVADVEADETADLFMGLTQHFAARPDWRADILSRMVAQSRRKANYGGMVRRKVMRRDGRPIGFFLYYGNPGGIGRVVQILSEPGQEGIVIDAMLSDAAERGLVALRGRTMPFVLREMLGRRMVFLHASSSIVHARDRQLLVPFTGGQAFFNGFAGESWSRLIGDRFDGTFPGKD